MVQTLRDNMHAMYKKDGESIEPLTWIPVVTDERTVSIDIDEDVQRKHILAPNINYTTTNQKLILASKGK